MIYDSKSSNRIDIELMRSEIVNSVVYDCRTTGWGFEREDGEYVFRFGCNSYKLIHEEKTDGGFPIKEVWYHPLLKTVVVIEVLKDEMCCYDMECERFMEFKVSVFKVKRRTMG